MFVCEHISGTTGLIFAKFYMQIPCGRGSFLLWRRCDTLCTSGFMDNITFGRNGPYGDAWLAALQYRGGVWCIWMSCFVHWSLNVWDMHVSAWLSPVAGGLSLGEVEHDGCCSHRLVWPISESCPVPCCPFSVSVFQWTGHCGLHTCHCDMQWVNACVCQWLHGIQFHSLNQLVCLSTVDLNASRYCICLSELCMLTPICSECMPCTKYGCGNQCVTKNYILSFYTAAWFFTRLQYDECPKCKSLCLVFVHWW